MARGLQADNARLADVLERIAALLEAQKADPFQVRAYRNVGRMLVSLPVPVGDVLREGGSEGLMRLPGVGPSLAATIREYLETGGVGMLRRLEGAVSPEDLFTTVPGIGEALAQRIHRTLDIESLEDLEVAAHDGRLATVPGFGPRRTRAVREELSSMLRRSIRRLVGGAAAAGSGPSGLPGLAPDVRTLLEVDAEYRRRAEAGDLRTIAPRRFNPQRRSWLPIFHTRRGPWSMTALYSNTALAHRLGRTRDWVIVYYERDGLEGQCTVVTELRGELAGRRVVRGRELECASHHATETGQFTPPADHAA
jgi:hypothetical protein